MKKIKKLIPDVLRSELEKESELNLNKDVINRSKNASKELANKINEFILKYNRKSLLEKRYERISNHIITSALFRNIDESEVGFTIDTADVFCLYISEGKNNWYQYFKDNQEILEEYDFNTLNNSIRVQQERTIELKNILHSNITTNIKLQDELTKYIEKVSKEIKEIYLPFAKEITKIPIDDITVPLLCKESLIPEYSNFEKKYTGKNEIIDDINLMDEIFYENNIIIEFEGGTGKTTLLKHTFYELSNRFLKNNDIYFPLFIKLKSINSIKSYIEYEFGSIESFKNFTKHYTVIYLLDGLDEISEYNLSILSELKNDISYYSNNCKIVLTTRKIEYTKDFVFEGYNKYYLKKTFNLNIVNKYFKSQYEIQQYDQFINSKKLDPIFLTNAFYCTSLIVYYKKNKEYIKNKNKLQILQNIIEDNYISGWESINYKYNSLFIEYQIKPQIIIQILSLISLLNVSKKQLAINKDGNYYINTKVICKSVGIDTECLQNIIKLVIPVNEIILNPIINFIIDTELM